MAQASIYFYSAAGAPPPAVVESWLETRGLSATLLTSPDVVMQVSLRSRPKLVILDFGDESAGPLARRLKADSYTAVVPLLGVNVGGPAVFEAAFAAGADEILPSSMLPLEQARRIDLLLRRSERDVNVHPSTRLPGTVEIEAELQRRIDRREPFAVCYADLDHFKEYNDRYSYYDGDRVIRVLAKLLHDVVKGLCGEAGFVGHIGGDDFIFVIPSGAVRDVCTELVSVFDAIVPCQYSEQDRRAGYFFGKDRRGQLHRVPLMTLSIGVVTSERRHFTTAAQASQLATEMKSYAKTLSGSVYSVDRRSDYSPDGAEVTPQRPPRAISMIDD